MLRQALRELFGILPTLDLHGLGVRDALAECEQFLREARQNGESVVRIVYGKGRRSPAGRGVLRQVVPHWLDHEAADLITHYERQPDLSGLDGAVKVWLRVDSGKSLP
jgi:DNA-nicking Smr family endonuclease